MSDHSDPEDTPEQPDEIQADAELGVAEQVADGAVPTEAAVGAVQAAADFGRVGELVASSVLNMKNLADIRRHLPSKAALKAEFGEGEVFELKIKRKEELEKYIDGQTLQGQEYRMSVCDAYAKIGGVKRNFERLWNTVVTGGFNDEILKVVEKDFALLQDATPELEALQKEMAAKARTDLKKIQEDIKELSMGGSEHLNNLIKEIDATTSAVLAATKELRDEELKFHTANTKNIINLAHLDNTLTSAKEQKEAATKEIEKLRADYETSVAAHKDAKTQNQKDHETERAAIKAQRDKEQEAEFERQEKALAELKASKAANIEDFIKGQKAYHENLIQQFDKELAELDKTNKAESEKAQIKLDAVEKELSGIANKDRDMDAEYRNRMAAAENRLRDGRNKAATVDYYKSENRSSGWGPWKKNWTEQVRVDMSNARYQGRLAANKAESDIRSLRAEMDTWEKTKDKKRSRDALRQALQTLENKAAALATRRTRERPKPYSDVDEKAMKDKIADINNMAFTEEDKSKIRKEFDTRQNAKLKSADDGAKALGDLIHENHLEELREILPKFCGKLLIHLGTNYGRQESEDGALDWPAALVLHGTIHGGEAHLTKIINDREQERAKLGTESIALTEKWAKKEAELKEALKEADTKAAEAMKKGQNETSDEVMSLKSLAIVSNIIQSAAEIQANAGLVTEILPVCIQTLVAMIKEKESFCGGLIALTSVSDDKLTADAMKGAGAEMKKKVKDKFLETCLEENLEDDDTKPLAEFLVKTTKLMAFKDLSTLDDEESKASRLVQKQYKGAVTKGKLGADQELEVGMLAGKVHEEVDSFWNEYEKQYIDEHKYANRRAAGQVAFAPVVAFCATLPEVTEITARILEEGNRVNELIKADQKAIQE